jgi:hypothetical protein
LLESTTRLRSARRKACAPTAASGSWSSRPNQPPTRVLSGGRQCPLSLPVPVQLAGATSPILLADAANRVHPRPGHGRDIGGIRSLG